MMEISDFKYAHRVRVEGECWLWVVPEGYKSPYPAFLHGMAYRVIYEELVGPVEKGMDIDHKCHNNFCVRPAHLRQITRRQNMENRRGAHKNNRTGVRNVMITRGGAYQVRVTSNKKTYTFGTYADLEEAARVAKEARQKLHTHGDGR